MDEEEKKYNSNKEKSNTMKAQYMKFNEDEDDEDNISESEKKDTYDINSNESNNSEYISKNGNKINLSGKDLSTESSKILIKNLYKKYPNITELDINNCNLEIFPKILLNFKKLATP